MTIETLAKRIHEVYQQEAKRQGDVRHSDDYDALDEKTKDFDRAIVRFILQDLITADAPKHVVMAWLEVSRYLKGEINE